MSSIMQIMSSLDNVVFYGIILIAIIVIIAIKNKQ